MIAPFEINAVKYECSCKKLNTLYRIYFCRHCLKVRCRDCCSHEVDSQYCQHCLEYIPTIDAKLKKNKCSSCFSCPCCFCTLNTRATVILIPSAEDETQLQQKKMYFLTCFYCKWSSREANIPDQPTANGNWPELETPNRARIEEMFSYYRNLAQKEKMESTKKRVNPRPGHALHLLEKYGISEHLSSNAKDALRLKKFGRIPNSPSGDLMKMSPTTPSSAEATMPKSFEDMVKEYESLNLDDNYNPERELPFDVTKVASLDQRFKQVELQPKDVNEFHPFSQMLSVKRSLRCKECDHNLSKPEYNPSSIKFKILLAAYYHLPEVKVVTNLRSPNLFTIGVEGNLEISVQNPTPYQTAVTIIPHMNDEWYQMSMQQEVSLTMPPKDDTLDLDLDMNLMEKQKPMVHSGKELVIMRKGNKVQLRIPFIPHKVSSSNGLSLAIIIKHGFVNATISASIGSASEKKEPQIEIVTQKVSIQLPASCFVATSE